MNLKSYISFAFVLLLTGVVGGYIGASSTPSKPPVVGTVNLRILIDKLDERKALEKRLDQIEQVAQDELSERRSKIDELDADLEDYVPGTAKFEEARNAWGLEAMKYEAFREYTEAKRQYEKNDSYRRMYIRIKRESKIFATEYGLDLILLDDGSEEVVNSGNQFSIKAEMKARKIIYGSETLDITEELSNFMNNRFDEDSIEK